MGKVAAVASHLAYEKELAGRGRKRRLKPRELVQNQQAAEDGEGGEEGVQGGRVFKWKRERKR